MGSLYNQRHHEGRGALRLQSSASYPKVHLYKLQDSPAYLICSKSNGQAVFKSLQTGSVSSCKSSDIPLLIISEATEHVRGKFGALKFGALMSELVVLRHFRKSSAPFGTVHFAITF